MKTHPGAGRRALRVALDAPAKLNLGLRIVGRRPDGYHTLESLFVPLDWGDRIEVELDAGGVAGVDFRMETPGSPDSGRESSALSGAAVPAGAENLAARAARAFLGASGWRGALRVTLHKRLPAAAGLGGGSSDAGAVLRALDRLLPGLVPRERLAELALGLGADVPFFLDPRPALVSGIGERIAPVAGLPELWLVLANPGKNLATAAVYAAWDASPAALTPTRAGSTMRALSRILGTPASAPRAISEFLADELLLTELLVNDLEPAACRLCPGVADLQERLRSSGARGTGMSGSGATVYGVFRDEADAARAQALLLDRPMGESDRPVGERETVTPARAWARVVRSFGSAPASREGSADLDPGASPNW